MCVTKKQKKTKKAKSFLKQKQNVPVEETK